MNTDAILAVNGGSSSLKCTLFKVPVGEAETQLSFKIHNIFGQPHCRIRDSGNRQIADVSLKITDEADAHSACLHYIFEWLRNRSDFPPISAVGHRVVHGGNFFSAPVLVDSTVLSKLRGLSALAPLHQPVNLKLIETCESEHPGIPQVACFDTSFHQLQPAVARMYALPKSLTKAGISAYGFHGISYEYIWNKLQDLDVRVQDKLIIVAHLGAGASLCAIKSGRSIATTMGFSTADGLPMATRCGSIDPGVMIYLLREHRMTTDELEQLIYKKSGLHAISGVSAGMRELHNSTDPRARTAIDYFVYRAVREIGSLIAALGGLDTLVFTGGIGENDARVRREIADAFQWMGVQVDAQANTNGNTIISTGQSSIDLRVIPTNEEALIASHTALVLKSGN